MPKASPRRARRTRAAAPSTNGHAAAGHVKDLQLARAGRLRIEGAERSMPVLRTIRARFAKHRPLKGLRIAARLHVTTETANLARTLQPAGAPGFGAASDTPV